MIRISDIGININKLISMTENMSETKQNAELWKLFKIRKTVLQTMKDRKYQVPEGAERLPFSDFITLHSKNRHHLFFPTMEIPLSEGDVGDDRKGVLVYFEPLKDFTKKILEARVSRLEDEYPNLARLFFVLKINGKKKKGRTKVNAFVSNALNKPELSYVRIMDDIYQFDFMENVVLPRKITLLTTEERDKVLESYQTELKFFKKMESTDPVAKRVGARVDDMIYIERNGGLEIDYRVIVLPGTS